MFKSKRKKTREIIKLGILAGLFEAIFVFLVGGYFLVAEILFPPESKSLILGIVSVLILLVVGVGLSAVLVFGLPAYFFLGKKYRAALIAFFSTVGVLLVIFTAIVLLEIFLV